MNHVEERIELAAADDRDRRGVVSRHPRIDVSPPAPSTGAIDAGLGPPRAFLCAQGIDGHAVRRWAFRTLRRSSDHRPGRII